MRRRAVALILAITISSQSIGCATIIKGGTQPIGITSDPSGAWVQVNGKDKGNTPVVVKMRRAINHTVMVGKEGYEPYEATIIKKPGGWIWGNLLFGGLIGLVVDLITQANNNLVPDKVHATLETSS